MIHFNLDARVTVQEVAPGREVLVFDDALQDPDALVRLACAQQHDLQPSPHNAYPGIMFPLDATLRDRTTDFFSSMARSRLGARRVLHANVRLAMVTTPPAQLQARQTIPHRDSQSLDASQTIIASVLYLFRDASLGGTSFYRAQQGDLDTRRLIHDSSTLGAAEFAARTGIPTAYFQGSNAWFEHLATIPARWNRLIFYDGGEFHCGSIDAPEQLSGDPAQGRLTLNGFFTCSRRAA
ncbi:MAG: hypothetical protein JNK75_03715 [Betaproteobacteria bacterium]|nr:hypothetical protein [Betaproteobacteria bacterium]